MSRKPSEFEWSDVTEVQRSLLNQLDFLGGSAWHRTRETEKLIPGILRRLGDAGLTFDEIKHRMRSIGYSRNALRQLELWQSTRGAGTADDFDRD